MARSDRSAPARRRYYLAGGANFSQPRSISFDRVPHARCRRCRSARRVPVERQSRLRRRGCLRLDKPTDFSDGRGCAYVARQPAVTRRPPAPRSLGRCWSPPNGTAFADPGTPMTPDATTRGATTVIVVTRARGVQVHRRRRVDARSGRALAEVRGQHRQLGRAGCPVSPRLPVLTNRRRVACVEPERRRRPDRGERAVHAGSRCARDPIRPAWPA